MLDVPHDRDRVAVEMQHEIVGCHITHFMEHYMPPLPSRTAFRVVKKHLIDEGILQQIDTGAVKRYAWTAFPTRPSEMPREREERMFKRLEPICEAIGSLEFGSRKSTLVYVDGPFKSTGSEIGGGTHKMDGTMKLKDSLVLKRKSKQKAQIITADVAVNMEYKVECSPSKVAKNRRQLLGGALHIKHNDPVRSHTYSLSIEDDHVTVWYWSPSHSAMSDTFSFIDNPDLFIKVLISFLYASLKELGYSSAIERAIDPDTKKICYLYTTHGPPPRIYKTVECLYEKHALSFTGRAPRVWVVVEVASKTDLTAIGAKRVLKDYWLDQGEPNEKEIQEAIFADLEKISGHISSLPNGEGEFAGVHDETAKELRACFKDARYKEHFLKILDTGVIGKSKPVSENGCYSPSNLLYLPERTPGMKTDRVLPQASQRPTTANLFSATSASYDSASHAPSYDLSLWTPERPFCPKERHLLIYEEVCTVLHELESLEIVFTVMLDCLLALQLLALAGWIHRDISSGNILGYRVGDAYRGKLGDLEFSKKCNVAIDLRKDPKTGTPFFMAVEILQQESFGEDSDSEDSEPEQPRDAVEIDWDDGLATADDPSPVRHNVIHDTESFFWLVAWFLLTHVKRDDLDDDQWHFRSRMFQNGGGCTKERASFLKRKKVMGQVLALLHRTLRLHALQTSFEKARSNLMRYYRRTGATDHSSSSPPTEGRVIEAIRLLIIYARKCVPPARKIPYIPHTREEPVEKYGAASDRSEDSEKEKASTEHDSSESSLGRSAISIIEHGHSRVRGGVEGEVGASEIRLPASAQSSDVLGSSLGKRRAEDPEPSSSDEPPPTSGPRKKARSKLAPNHVSQSQATKGSRRSSRLQLQAKVV